MAQIQKVKKMVLSDVGATGSSKELNDANTLSNRFILLEYRNELTVMVVVMVVLSQKGATYSDTPNK